MILAKLKKLKSVRLGGHIKIEAGEAVWTPNYQTYVWNDDVDVLGVFMQAECVQEGYGAVDMQLSRIGTFQTTQFDDEGKHDVCHGILATFMQGTTFKTSGGGTNSGHIMVWAPDGTSWAFDDGDAMYLHLFQGIHYIGFFEVIVYYVER